MNLAQGERTERSRYWDLIYKKKSKKRKHSRYVCFSFNIYYHVKNYESLARQPCNRCIYFLQINILTTSIPPFQCLLAFLLASFRCISFIFGMTLKHIHRQSSRDCLYPDSVLLWSPLARLRQQQPTGRGNGLINAYLGAGMSALLRAINSASPSHGTSPISLRLAAGSASFDVNVLFQVLTD